MGWADLSELLAYALGCFSWSAWKQGQGVTVMEEVVMLVMLVMLAMLAMRVIEVEATIFMITMDMDMGDTVRWMSQEKWIE